MKAKTKPVKGSARVKKFDVGGTVGALAGLGTLAYLLSRKKKGADGGKGLGKFPMEAGDGTSGPGMDEYKPKDDAATQRAKAASMGQPEMGDGDKAVMESDKDAKRTGVTTKPVIKKTAPSVKATSSATTTTSAKQGKVSTTGVDAGIDAGGRKSKPSPNMGKPNDARPSKPYPTEQAEVNKLKNTPGVTVMKPSDKEIKDIKAKQDAAARAKKGQGFTPYAPSGREEIMRKNRFHKEAELGRGIKKGGAVKKYAAGGSVGSASKRADGIAQRGKTRGKVL